ncbi:MAG: tRNA pseudouridine(55) synthase TruB [Candidatus Sulfotelmatobacter sp.]
MNGILIIDKPAGLTSHDVVNRVRRIMGQRSIGHLGTLDPMATGVLPLVTGSFTRLAQFYVASEKTYEGVIRFGFSTDTYDAEGDPTSEPQSVNLSREELEAHAAKFRGVIEQVPPPFSAKKIKGVPAYKLARKHKEIVLQPVQVEIKEFEILTVEADRASFRARVASGTYMRSVAHDLGQLLGCGAHLESLRRTSVAEFTLADAHTLEALAEAKSNQHAKDCYFHDGDVRDTGAKDCHPDRSLPLPQGKASGEEGPCVAAAALDELFVHPRKLLPQLPSVTADEQNTARIRAGRPVNLPELSRARQVKVFAGQRDLIAIATRVAGTLFHAKLVLSTADIPARQL